MVILQITGYLGRIWRILVLRGRDAIGESGKEGLLWSEMMEEEVILWNVSFFSDLFRFFRGSTE